MTTKAPHYVDVTMANRRKLARLFNVTDKMVSYALTYVKNSDLAKKIRYVAMRDFGGVAMRHCPACETFHNHTAEGCDVMEQSFDNGATVIANKTTGIITVTNRKGVEVGRYEVSGLQKLAEAQMLAETL